MAYGGGECARERGAQEGATRHSDENISHIAPLLHHRIFISGLSLITLIYPPSRSVSEHCSIGACTCEQQECRRTPRVRPAPSRHRTFVYLPLSNTTTTCVGASALSSEAGAQVSTTAESGLPDTISWTSSRAEPECQKARQKVRAGAAPSET